MKRVDVASALIFDETNENILMVLNKNKKSSYWSLPGGAVEDGETLEQAVCREAKEETGFEIAIHGIYSVREKFFTAPGHHAVFFTFHASIIGGEVNIADPDNEIAEVKWMDLQTANEVMSSLLPDKIRSPHNMPSIPYFFQGTK